MKREELEKLGLEKEIINSVMGLHQKDVETWTNKITKVNEDKEKLVQDLEKFKDVDLDKIKNNEKELETLKTEKEKLVETHTKELESLKFNSALDKAISGSKTIDEIALKSHLNLEQITFDAEKGLSGFDEQVESIKKERSYLFTNVNTGTLHGRVDGGPNQTLDLGSALKEKMEKGE